MIANNQESWNDQDDNQGNFSNPEGSSFGQTNEPDSDFNEDDELDEDLNEGDDSSDEDLNEDYEVSDELTDTELPDENPGTSNTGEEISTPRQSEASQQREGADATFTERNDVTPPAKKEFPSEGPAKMDFESRPHGRTTGRMIGHEPGTEAI